MSDQENPTRDSVKASILLMRLRGRSAKEIAAVVDMPVLLVQEVLRAGGWPNQAEAAATAQRLSGGVDMLAEQRDDSVQALCVLAQRVGTQRMRTLAERLTRTQTEILDGAKEAAEKKRARDADAQRRAKLRALDDQKKKLRAEKKRLAASESTISGQIAELNEKIAALKEGVAS